MGDTFCFMCKKKVGFMTGKIQAKHVKQFGRIPPSGMGDKDKICNDCHKTLTRIIEPIPKIKSNPTKLESSKALHYKDDKCAILILFTSGNYDEFNREFSQLTSQGYDLKTSYVPPASIAGFSIALGSFFYFQKLKTENDEANIRSPIL